MRDYKKIKAYQLADKLTLEIYKLTKSFPHHEIFGITSQIRRSSVSVAANIAEGASRQHQKDYLNFLYIARGSLAETEHLLNLARQLEYCRRQEAEEITNLLGETSKTLYGLIAVVSQP